MKFFITKPASARNYRQLAFLCALGSIWSFSDLYQAFHALPALQGVGPLLPGYGSEGYSTLPFKIQSLVSIYGYAQVPEHLPTPVFVIYLRIVLHFFFWAITSVLLWVYSSRLDRLNDGCRLFGTLLVGLVVIDEMVRVKIRGTAYAHEYYVNSLAQRTELMILFLIVLLLLTPWPRLLHLGRYKVKT